MITEKEDRKRLYFRAVVLLIVGSFDNAAGDGAEGILALEMARRPSLCELAAAARCGGEPLRSGSLIEGPSTPRPCRTD